MKELEGQRRSDKYPRKCRFKLYGHVMRRVDEYVGKTLLRMDVGGGEGKED